MAKRKAPKPDSQAVPQATSSSSAEAQQAQVSDSRPASDASTQGTDSHEDRPENASPAGRSDAGNASHAPPTGNEPRENASTSQQAGRNDAGNVPESTTTEAPSEAFSYARVRERLMQHAEWPQIIGTVKEMRLDPKLAKMRAEYRERFIWGEMDRLYPPSKAQSIALLEGSNSASALPVSNLRQNEAPPPLREAGVKGLGDIPPGWPSLPANASLAAELQWVQANRLYVVEELASGGTRVHLDRAHEPAPSRSAIGWLETSIRSYAKFVEVAAKASTGGDEDGEQMKREKMQIEEIRGLLAEMAGNPPAPGR